MLREFSEWNASYFPVRFESEEKLLSTVEKMGEMLIFPRRYFHPALHEIDLMKDTEITCPVAANSSRKLLCLPLCAQTSHADVERVLDVMSYVDRIPTTKCTDPDF